MCEFGHGGQVDDLESGIRWGFEKHRPGAASKCLFPFVERGTVDLHGLNTESGQDLAEDDVARTEECTRPDDLVASANERSERREHGCHTAGGRHTRFGAFDQAKPFLEHRHGRVAVARIDVTIVLAGEGRFGLGSASVHIPRRKK